MARLGDRFRMAAVNFSGYGETERWAGARPLSLSDEAESVVAIAEQLSSPVHLVGHSYGGAVALILALGGRVPVKTLTLIEPAAYPMLKHAGEHAIADDVETVNMEYVATVAHGEHERAFRSYIDYYTNGPGSWDALPEKTRARFLTIAEVVAAVLTAAHADDTHLDEVRKLALPTLLIYGGETSKPHEVFTEILVQRIPGAELKIVEPAGHMLTLTHPDEVASLIATFVEARG